MSSWIAGLTSHGEHKRPPALLAGGADLTGYLTYILLVVSTIQKYFAVAI
jgi:hypothetical protein